MSRSATRGQSNEMREAVGEILVMRLRQHLRDEGFSSDIGVAYVPDAHALRFTWPRSNSEIEFPATNSWVRRIRDALPHYRSSLAR